MNDKDQKAIPKFASFRPRPSSKSEEDVKQKSSKHQLNDVERRGPFGRGGRHNRQEALTTTDSWRLRNVSSLSSPTDDRSGSREFSIDTTGDVANIEYGSLHKYSVPSYYRSGRGSVLGLSRGLKIDPKLSTGKEVFLFSTYEKLNVVRNKALWSRSYLSHGQYIRPNPLSATNNNQVAEYISLDSNRSRKRRRVDSYLSDGTSTSKSGDEVPTHGASTERAKQDHGIVTEQSSHIDAGSRDAIEKGSYALNTIAALDHRVRDNPTDGQGWLDLIKHQGSTFHQFDGRETISDLKAEHSSIAQLKLSIAEKALKSVKDIYYEQKLLRIYMHEGSQIWDSTRISKKWTEIIAKYKYHPLLRLDHLNCLLSRSTQFSVNDVKDSFAAAVQDLVGGSIETASYWCYILLRLTLLLREAGYEELASAIWQANLEFNLFRPIDKQDEKSIATAESLLNLFEEFWESEVPRVGEDGSHGWKASLDGENEPPKAATDPPLPSESELQLAHWRDQECLAAKQACLAARTLDDVGENDPYRVIIFSDVQPFLISIESSHGDSSSLLASAFCAFCGLPPTPYLSVEQQWWRDPFIRHPRLDEMTEGCFSDRSSTSLYATCPLARYDTTTAFFKPDHLFALFSDTKRTQLSSWARRVLQKLVHAKLGGDRLAEYYLSVESQYEPASSRKSARSLIKKQPYNLRLYNAYAAIEAANGKPEPARSTLTTVLKTHDQHSDAGMIWVSRVWLCLERAAFQDALAAVMEYPKASSDTQAQDPSKAALLRVQSALAESRDQLCSLGDFDHAVQYIELLMLLQYLYNDQSLEAALSSFASSLNLLPERSETLPHCELLHQSRAHLLYIHMTNAALFSPSVIRTALEESISLFPNNTIFLYLFAHLERRFRIDDRVRSTVQSLLDRRGSAHDRSSTSSNADSSYASGSEGSIIPHYFAIDVELQRATDVGGSVHAVRSAFERAVCSEDGRRNAGLWKWYCSFECEKGEMKRAREVFYRAIAACPWVKELYLMAFDELAETMSVKELKGVYETMLDREIRVRIPLDEVFERLEAGNQTTRS